MPYRKPALSPYLQTDPEKVRRLIRKAFRDSGCKRTNTAKALDVGTATLSGWIDVLGMEAELTQLEEKAKEEGWHHGDVGGRPKGSGTRRRLHVAE